MKRYKDVEDGMGFSGLLPTAKEKREQAEIDLLLSELSTERKALELAYQYILHNCVDDNVSPEYFRNKAKE